MKDSITSIQCWENIAATRHYHLSSPKQILSMSGGKQISIWPEKGLFSSIDRVSVTLFLTEDFRLSGSIIRKSRFIFTKERRTIWQKSGCLNNSNELK